MRVTVLGSCGAWPEAGRATAGFLVDHDGFRLVVDLGFATVPRLLGLCPAGAVDAVVVTHRHVDHVADLPALLRARLLGDRPAPPLDVHCPPGAVDAALALEPRDGLAPGVRVHDLGELRAVGPFSVRTVALPHHVATYGVRLTAGDAVLAYTSDTGPDPGIVELAAGADVLICDATYTGEPPAGHPPYLLSATQAGDQAAAAGVGRLVLTHFWPGTDRARAVREAAAVFAGPVLAAREGLVIDVPRRERQAK